MSSTRNMVYNAISLLIAVKICFLQSLPLLEQQSPMFWHLTDLHYDLNYSAQAGDRAKMCWDTHDGHGGPLGQYGDYSCDSPQTLVRSVLDAMKALCPNPKFILWTGDDSAHVDASYFPLDVEIDIMNQVTKQIKGTFPNVTIVPVLGNHDSYPKQQFSSNRSQFYSLVADLWKDMLQEGHRTFKIGGYYSKMLPMDPKVKAICLNTPLYYDKNPLVDESDDDPAGQFAWLESQLTNATTNGYKVYLVAHVPVGMFERKVLRQGYSWMRPKYNRRLTAIIEEYATVIIAVFFGHHHTDSFRLFYDKQGNPATYALIAPAVTPWNTTLAGIGPNNPGVRLLRFDSSNGNLNNYWQYYMDLDESNRNHADSWQLEYDYLSAFGQTELSASSLHAVAQTFNAQSTCDDLFDKYYKYNSVSYTNSTLCDQVCRMNHFCAVTQVDYGQFRSCNTATDNNESL